MTKAKRRGYVLAQGKNTRSAKSTTFSGSAIAYGKKAGSGTLSRSLTTIPDLNDEATYRRLRAEAEEELREDRRNAQKRAFRSLLGLG